MEQSARRNLSAESVLLGPEDARLLPSRTRRRSGESPDLLNRGGARRREKALPLAPNSWHRSRRRDPLGAAHAPSRTVTMVLTQSAPLGRGC